MFTIPPVTSDILAISFDGPASPTINVTLPEDGESGQSYGWGFGWYPGDQQSAIVTKDPAAGNTRILMEALTDWSNFRSTAFFCKMRGASKGYTFKETQPFSRSFAGRDWLFMHNGDLDKDALDKLHGEQVAFMEPLGRTDSELAFCELLDQFARKNARRISDVSPADLLQLFQRFDTIGNADMYFTDGETIACFQGTQSNRPLSYMRLQPPNNLDEYDCGSARFKLTDPRDTYRTALIISSATAATGQWTAMQPGELALFKRGTLVWSSTPDMAQPSPLPTPLQQQQPPPQQPDGFLAQTQGEQAQSNIMNVRAMSATAEGAPLEYRMYEVKHATLYEYSEPVEHSTHFLRLQPVDDPLQEVVYSSLAISSAAEKIQFEDVFGNQSVHAIINQPYNRLTIEATSHVKIFAAPPDDHSLSRRQTLIPLSWMPWQRQMMMPYLLPPEAPESQLSELMEYALSFVARNDSHLLKTLEDMNTSIYRDYAYVPGTTSLSTTPFEVYTSREGVCQDFANLFICLARLLSIPARYRMGYIYTGANYENKIQSDASHAWAEVYLPYVGWRGFDPTNGCMVAQDHIRIACGRNYRDATPTAGTIYKGGGTETLSVDVKMREIQNT